MKKFIVIALFVLVGCDSATNVKDFETPEGNETEVTFAEGPYEEPARPETPEITFPVIVEEEWPEESPEIGDPEISEPRTPYPLSQDPGRYRRCQRRGFRTSYRQPYL